MTIDYEELTSIRELIRAVRECLEECRMHGTPKARELLRRCDVLEGFLKRNGVRHE